MTTGQDKWQHTHEYVVRNMGPECEHCGLLKSTIEQTTPNPTPSWEERFDKQFLISDEPTEDMESLGGNYKEVKSFIQVERSKEYQMGYSQGAREMTHDMPILLDKAREEGRQEGKRIVVTGDSGRILDMDFTERDERMREEGRTLILKLIEEISTDPESTIWEYKEELIKRINE